MNDSTQTGPAQGNHGGELLAAVSREMNQLYKDQFDRGATTVRTEWAGPNTLVAQLENTLTPAERNLVKLGEHQRLRDVRMFFQYSTVREFCEPVEQLTGRKVRAFLSAIDTEVDGLALEVFVLAPVTVQCVGELHLRRGHRRHGRVAAALSVPPASRRSAVARAWATTWSMLRYWYRARRPTKVTPPSRAASSS